jgi:hypothetical protein
VSRGSVFDLIEARTVPVSNLTHFHGDTGASDKAARFAQRKAENVSSKNRQQIRISSRLKYRVRHPNLVTCHSSPETPEIQRHKAKSNRRTE